MEPNWKMKYKTREKADEGILQSLLLNPACAGSDGTIDITYKGQFLSLVPIKKKKNEKKN